ncbi:hypothetical protein KIH31_17525 [Paenarthrobacter sp. DKR-5]|uniref:hypothetical protein n=1 Tax=Paenarthrobacter sp. DKR-5 TaxID=2835535 RepID=UPI001BDC7E1E|nr:hypothetical protein [Paenarthrobacter sp. DKR-5]MBT1004389.1 hypothetical protein [Paenarthrobacter sp. DKR-5]
MTRLAVLRAWSRGRWGAAAAVAVVAAVVIGGANDLFGLAGITGHAAALLLTAAGAAVGGLLMGSYIGAPEGAEPTVCDIRWPLFGFAGLSLATTGNPNSLLMQMFSGLGPAVLHSAVQPALGALSVALMAGTLAGRLNLEGRALSDPEGAAACTSCTPLRPAVRRQRPGRSGPPPEQ